VKILLAAILALAILAPAAKSEPRLWWGAHSIHGPGIAYWTGREETRENLRMCELRSVKNGLARREWIVCEWMTQTDIAPPLTDREALANREAAPIAGHDQKP
jgi:hypothetical protein